MFKKTYLLFITIIMFGVTACSNKESRNNYNSHTVNVEYRKNNIDDDESTICEINTYREDYHDYDLIKEYIDKEYKHKNNDYYWVLYTEKINNTPLMPSFTVAYDQKVPVNAEELAKVKGNSNINNVLEHYFIYDEELGNMSNTDMDVPYYSIKFTCIFYKVDINSKITTYCVDYISDTKIKIILKADSEIVGYVYAKYGNYDAVEYVITYLENNLILI